MFRGIEAQELGLLLKYFERGSDGGHVTFTGIRPETKDEILQSGQVGSTPLIGVPERKGRQILDHPLTVLADRLGADAHLLRDALVAEAGLP